MPSLLSFAKSLNKFDWAIVPHGENAVLSLGHQITLSVWRVLLGYFIAGHNVLRDYHGSDFSPGTKEL